MVFDVWSIVIAVLVLLAALLGLKSGFAKQIKFVFGFFGALVAAILLYKLFYLLLVQFGVESSIAGKLESVFLGKGGVFTETVTESTYSDVIAGILNTLKIPEFLSGLVIKKFPYDAAYEGLTYANVLGSSLGKLLTNAISFIVILIVAWIVLAIVYKAIKGIANIELIKPLDKVLGLAIGAIKAALLIAAVLWGLSLLASMNNAVGDFVTKIAPKDPGEDAGFSLGWWAYQNNPLVHLIGLLF